MMTMMTMMTIVLGGEARGARGATGADARATTTRASSSFFATVSGLGFRVTSTTDAHIHTRSCFARSLLGYRVDAPGADDVCVVAPSPTTFRWKLTGRACPSRRGSDLCDRVRPVTPTVSRDDVFTPGGCAKWYVAW